MVQLDKLIEANVNAKISFARYSDGVVVLFDASVGEKDFEASAVISGVDHNGERAEGMPLKESIEKITSQFVDLVIAETSD